MNFLIRNFLRLIIIIMIFSCEKDNAPKDNNQDPNDQNEADTIYSSIDSAVFIEYFSDTISLYENPTIDINGDGISDISFKYNVHTNFQSQGGCYYCIDRTYKIFFLNLHNNFFAEGIGCSGSPPSSSRFLLQDSSKFQFENIICWLDNAYFSFEIDVHEFGDLYMDTDSSVFVNISYTAPDYYWGDNEIAYLPIKECIEGYTKYGYITLGKNASNKLMFYNIWMTKYFVEDN